MSELKTNRIVPRDGLVSATNYGGGIIQCKMGVKTDTFSGQGDNAGTFIEITGLSVTITPTRSDSKIMIDGSVVMVADTADYHMGLKITRGSSDISGFIGAASGNRTACMAALNTTGNVKPNTVPLMCFDAPATTSAVTYKVYGSIESNKYFWINHYTSSSNVYSVYHGISTIRAWEISG